MTVEEQTVWASIAWPTGTRNSWLGVETMICADRARLDLAFRQGADQATGACMSRSHIAWTADFRTSMLAASLPHELRWAPISRRAEPASKNRVIGLPSRLSRYVDGAGAPTERRIEVDGHGSALYRAL